ncbi:Capsular polysaccharide biosynthesis protein [Desulfonispora thiosulfatigenes DSM 11270]|uniref:Capsular polysaccharide biosynthesis protein n=1 Tax=Desulfonispora thiosulfatigenes DSM 11270 TaxID=656914 RepID=A0A1W1V7D1_DESTI|nr:Wzz/FepE/Etk N-terminal domain-containing protein [Desulfonispora thiosulfatigenes]SMB88941.1 Capsular polysaccharide biosynthesis protein [Desulfonispora thiosulfatigenes DSM 11270]
MEDMDTIDLREYAEVLWKRKWLIAIITTVAMAISAIVSFYVLEPVYETFATMMVGKTKAPEQMVEYDDVLLSQKLVKTYGEIAKSKTVSKEVIANFGLDITPEQMKNKVTVSPVGDTEIIMIKVQDTDPELAAKLANNLSWVFMKHVTNFMKVDNVQVIDQAEVPKNPIKPNKLLNIAIAGILGLMISIGIIFILEYLDNTFKAPSDVEKYLDLPIIGAIPMMDEKTGSA